MNLPDILFNIETFTVLAQLFPELFQFHLTLDFRGEIRHRAAYPSDPASGIARDPRQAFGAEHQQCHHSDHDQFQKADFEHAVRACSRFRLSSQCLR
jgi:hypothetical protein